MKRDKIKTRSAKKHRSASTNIIPQPRDFVGVAPPPPTENGLLRWLALLGIVAVGAGALLVLMIPDVWKKTLPRRVVPGKIAKPAWEPEPWQPRTDEDRIIDRFFTLQKAGNKSALDLLGSAPVFDDEPVSEQTADARQTDFFLRSDLQFRDIWRGEPDGNGGQRTVPRRYTIVTKGYVSSPKLNIRTERGIDPGVQWLGSNPDLVVEVRNGRIYGLRAELHMGP
jgi:hypothetical protein